MNFNLPKGVLKYGEGRLETSNSKRRMFLSQ